MLTGIDLNSVRFAEPLYLWLLVIPAALLVAWGWQFSTRRRDARQFRQHRQHSAEGGGESRRPAAHRQEEGRRRVRACRRRDHRRHRGDRGRRGLRPVSLAPPAGLSALIAVAKSEAAVPTARSRFGRDTGNRSHRRLPSAGSISRPRAARSSPAYPQAPDRITGISAYSRAAIALSERCSARPIGAG